MLYQTCFNEETSITPKHIWQKDEIFDRRDALEEANLVLVGEIWTNLGFMAAFEGPEIDLETQNRVCVRPIKNSDMKGLRLYANQHKLIDG